MSCAAQIAKLIYMTSIGVAGSRSGINAGSGLSFGGVQCGSKDQTSAQSVEWNWSVKTACPVSQC